MSKIFVTSDIHGCHTEFNELLKKANYNSDADMLIILGDYVDRGRFSRQVIEQVIGLVSNGAIALRGNHDQMFLDALDNIEDNNFIRNGGMSTIESYIGEDCVDWDVYRSGKRLIKEKYSHHVDFLRNLPYYYETYDHIYVHAGINPFYNDSDWKTQAKDEFLWIRDMFLNNPTNLSKTIVHGHTPTSNFQETGDIIFSEGKINIDGGGVFGDQFNMLEIDNEASGNPIYTEHFIKGRRYM